MSSVALIVGLGNPGSRYEATRHNIGAIWLERIAQSHHASWRQESSFRGALAKITVGRHETLLFRPSSYMNESGGPVGLLARYYHIATSSILVAHDELDLSVGDVRLKVGGGHGGHNGLRDIVEHLNSNAFRRLRIGIGHPGNRDLVTDYVLSAPSKSEIQKIETSFELVDQVFEDLVEGNFDRAMRMLHAKGD